MFTSRYYQPASADLICIRFIAYYSVFSDKLSLNFKFKFQKPVYIERKTTSRSPYKFLKWVLWKKVRSIKQKKKSLLLKISYV